MRKISLCLIALWGAIFFSTLKAQDAVLPFEGTIQYRIKYESPLIPEEQLAQQPQIANLRILGAKAIFSMGETKKLADASTKELHTLVNLQAMGLGKYHILQTEAELLQESETITDIKNIKTQATEETKTIFGYTAHLTKVSYKEGSTNVEMDIWAVDGFCDDFLCHATQASGIKELKGFPIEYTIKTPDMSIMLTINKLTPEKVNEKYFNIPSSYKASTTEAMQKDVQEFMQSLQDMQGM